MPDRYCVLQDQQFHAERNFDEIYSEKKKKS